VVKSEDLYTYRFVLILVLTVGTGLCCLMGCNWLSVLLTILTGIVWSTPKTAYGKSHDNSANQEMMSALKAISTLLPYPSWLMDPEVNIVASMVNESYVSKLGNMSQENWLELLQRIKADSTNGVHKEKYEVNTTSADRVSLQVVSFPGDYYLFIEENAVNASRNEFDPALALIIVDNFDEVLQSTDENEKPALIAEIDNRIIAWSSRNDILVKKYAEDRYIGITNRCSLSLCRERKFPILEQIRDLERGNRITATLSMGISAGHISALELGQQAQIALDLALSRGGDQIVIRDGARTEYYGAKVNLPKRRSKVKARMAANAIMEFIDQSDQVFVIGHKAPDLDCFGSAVGAAVLARQRGKPVHIIIERDDLGIRRLSEKVIPAEALDSLFMDPNDVKHHVSPGTLLIVVDTNRPHLILMPELLNMVNSTIVIDHHRRVETTVDNPVLMYIDTYASSASELVTELYQYQGKRVDLHEWEASLLLAGMALDTKNFTIHTGVVTFESAAYLRKEGADPLLVRDMMRDDFSSFMLRAEIIHNIEIIKDNIAMGVYEGIIDNAGEVAGQTADRMLDIQGIVAAFVICRYSGGVWISGRSLGEMNVQRVLERLGGGGHMMGAGAQVHDLDLLATKAKLLEIIDELYREGTADESHP